MTSIATRPAIESDVPFIIDTWAQNFFANSHQAGVLPRREFLKAHLPFFAAVCNRHDVTPLVAYSPAADVGEEIYGYLIHEHYEYAPILHYAYVTDGLRKRGVMKHLLAELKVDVGRRFITTCFHPRLQSIRDRRAKRGLKFPYILDPRFLRDPGYKARYAPFRRRAIRKTVPTTIRRGHKVRPSAADQPPGR